MPEKWERKRKAKKVRGAIIPSGPGGNDSSSKLLFIAYLGLAFSALYKQVFINWVLVPIALSREFKGISIRNAVSL